MKKFIAFLCITGHLRKFSQWQIDVWSPPYPGRVPGRHQEVQRSVPSAAGECDREQPALLPRAAQPRGPEGSHRDTAPGGRALHTEVQGLFLTILQSTYHFLTPLNELPVALYSSLDCCFSSKSFHLHTVFPRSLLLPYSNHHASNDLDDCVLKIIHFG